MPNEGKCKLTSITLLDRFEEIDETALLEYDNLGRISLINGFTKSSEHKTKYEYQDDTVFIYESNKYTGDWSNYEIVAKCVLKDTKLVEFMDITNNVKTVFQRDNHGDLRKITSYYTSGNHLLLRDSTFVFFDTNAYKTLEYGIKPLTTDELELKNTTDFQYDEKYNPFYNNLFALFSAELEIMFFNSNNIAQYDWSFEGGGTKELSYKYNEYGYPIELRGIGVKGYHYLFSHLLFEYDCK